MDEEPTTLNVELVNDFSSYTDLDSKGLSWMVSSTIRLSPLKEENLGLYSPPFSMTNKHLWSFKSKLQLSVGSGCFKAICFVESRALLA